MKFVLITKDPEVEQAAKTAFPASDTLLCFSEWQEALPACSQTDIVFVDLISTLEDAHKIAGYENFAAAKMQHEIAKSVPLVLISPPEDYDLDFMVGWPDFVFAQVRRPVGEKYFRRAATWV